jgi:hypothetical protein
MGVRISCETRVRNSVLREEKEEVSFVAGGRERKQSRKRGMEEEEDAL